eukprot:360675-Chlamydomonas_euryale.AAC.5
MRRYAGAGPVPSGLANGVPVFSVPRLSGFILPEQVVGAEGQWVFWFCACVFGGGGCCTARPCSCAHSMSKLSALSLRCWTYALSYRGWGQVL